MYGLSFDTKFTLTQSLQVTALIPCIFLAFYLFLGIKRKSLAIIPIGYFCCLASGLVYRLLPAFTNIEAHSHLVFFLALMESFIPAVSFLLIFQLALGSLPPLIFWAILIVPAIATTPFVYAFVADSKVCSDLDTCFSSEYALHLNEAIVSLFIFMLLVVIFSRRSSEIEGSLEIRMHKYWLVIALVIYNIILIIIDLGFVSELITQERYGFARTMVKIAFIYMVMTSIFRVFTDLFEASPVSITISKNPLTEYEISIGKHAEQLLQEEKIYRELGLNRASLAKKLNVREHVLSRIVNLYFNKSVSELANMYRIKEAKELLGATYLPVTTISYDVGFSSIASFNRVFKELTGQSPTQYREMNPRNKEI